MNDEAREVMWVVGVVLAGLGAMMLFVSIADFLPQQWRGVWAALCFVVLGFVLVSRGKDPR